MMGGMRVEDIGGHMCVGGYEGGGYWRVNKEDTEYTNSLK